MNACIILHDGIPTAVVTNVPSTTSSAAILRKWLDWQGIPTGPPGPRKSYTIQFVIATSVVDCAELAKK